MFLWSVFSLIWTEYGKTQTRKTPYLDTFHAVTIKQELVVLDFRYWEAYSEPCQTPKIELFVKIVSGWKLLTIFAKSFILDIWRGSEYASDPNEWLKKVQIRIYMQSYQMWSYIKAIQINTVINNKTWNIIKLRFKISEKYKASMNIQAKPFKNNCKEFITIRIMGTLLKLNSFAGNFTR